MKARGHALRRAGAVGIAALLLVATVALAALTEVRLALKPGELALGRSDAPLTMVEFTDYECPFCRRFAAEVWPKLKKDYIDTG
jgi:protein-disulfide isomerase